MNPKEDINECISIIKSLFKQEGFSTGGQTFKRQNGEIYQEIKIQKSRFNNSISGFSFCINIFISPIEITDFNKTNQIQTFYNTSMRSGFLSNPEKKRHLNIDLWFNFVEDKSKIWRPETNPNDKTMWEVWGKQEWQDRLAFFDKCEDTFTFDDISEAMSITSNHCHKLLKFLSEIYSIKNYIRHYIQNSTDVKKSETLKSFYFDNLRD